jgi:hypothetical protein
MKNIRELKQLHFIEQNTHRMKIGKEYLCGHFLFYKDKNFVTSIIRIDRKTYKFKTYKKDFEGNLYDRI